MQLADNYAFSAVDDEGAVGSHQRNFAEEHFLLFDIANGLNRGFWILVVYRKSNRDLEGRGISHPTLFALRHVIFQLEANGIAATVTEGDNVLVEGAALVTKDITGMKGIGSNRGAASRIPACGTQVMQTLQIATFTFPVTNCVVNKFQLRKAAEIGDWEHAREYALQSGVVALWRQELHLQKTRITLLLHFDQIRNGNRGLDLREIDTLANIGNCCVTHVSFVHSYAERPQLKLQRSQVGAGCPTGNFFQTGNQAPAENTPQ